MIDSRQVPPQFRYYQNDWFAIIIINQLKKSVLLIETQGECLELNFESDLRAITSHNINLFNTLHPPNHLNHISTGFVVWG